MKMIKLNNKSIDSEGQPILINLIEKGDESKSLKNLERKQFYIKLISIKYAYAAILLISIFFQLAIQFSSAGEEYDSMTKLRYIVIVLEMLCIALPIIVAHILTRKLDKQQFFDIKRANIIMNCLIMLMIGIYIAGNEQQLVNKTFIKHLHLQFQQDQTDSYALEFEKSYQLARNFTMFNSSLIIIILCFLDKLIYQVSVVLAVFVYQYLKLIRDLFSYDQTDVHTALKHLWPDFLIILLGLGIRIIFAFIYTQTNNIILKSNSDFYTAEEKLKIIIEQMTSAVVLISQDDTIEFSNTASKQLITVSDCIQQKQQITFEQINANVVQITEVSKQIDQENADQNLRPEKKKRVYCNFKECVQSFREASNNLLDRSGNYDTKKSYSAIIKNQNRTMQLHMHLSLINFKTSQNIPNDRQSLLIQIEDVSQIMQLKVSEKNSQFQTTLLQNFSHQLLTPLNGIITPLDNSTLILSQLQTIQHSNQCSQLEQACTQEALENLAQCHSCFDTLQNFLLFINDFNLIIANEFVLLIKMFSFENFLRDIESRMIYCTRIKKIIFKFEYNPQDFPLFIYSDEIRLRQVIFKLIQNAIFFTPMVSQVTLSIKNRPFVGQEDIIEISVIDNGKGLTALQMCELDKTLYSIRSKESWPADEQSNLSLIDHLGIILIQHIAIQLGPQDNKDACGLFIESGQQNGTTFKFIISTKRRCNAYLRSSTSLRQKQQSDKSSDQTPQQIKMLTQFDDRLNIFPVPQKISPIKQESLILPDQQDQQQYLNLQQKTQQSLNLQQKTQQPQEKLYEIIQSKLQSYDQANEPIAIEIHADVQSSESSSSENSQLEMAGIQNMSSPTSFLNVSEHVKKIDVNADKIQKYFSEKDKANCTKALQFQNIAENQQEQKILSFSCNECKDILIVDDDAFNLLSLEMLTKKVGLTSKKAINGQEAVDILKQVFSTEYQQQHATCRKIQLIIMDYDMPVLNGVQATVEIKKMIKQNYMPDIPIIACTAYNAKKDIQACLDAGMKDYIRKPLTIDILKAVLFKFKIVMKLVQ